MVFGGRARGPGTRSSGGCGSGTPTRRPSDWSAPVDVGDGAARAERLGRRPLDRVPRTAPRTSRMPIFARQFTVPRGKQVADARLYLSGVGLHQPRSTARSSPTRCSRRGTRTTSSPASTAPTTSPTRCGAAATPSACELGNGPAYVRRSVTNPAVGRTAPYSWWQSQLKGNGVLAADAPAGATTVTLDNVTGYHVGGTINVDTGGGGDRLESRVDHRDRRRPRSPSPRRCRSRTPPARRSPAPATTSPPATRPPVRR